MKISVIKIICLSFLLLFTVSCASVPPEKIEFPYWVKNPPSGDGYVYGVGGHEDPSNAQIKSIVDIGQQLNTQIEAGIGDRSTSEGAEQNAVIS